MSKIQNSLADARVRLLVAFHEAKAINNNDLIVNIAVLMADIATMELKLNVPAKPPEVIPEPPVKKVRKTRTKA